jgi:hypothetical protein
MDDRYGVGTLWTASDLPSTLPSTMHFSIRSTNG